MVFSDSDVYKWLEALAWERGRMHAVARRLQVTPMALYRHVDDKNALLDGLVEMLLTEYPLPRAEGEPARPGRHRRRLRRAAALAPPGPRPGPAAGPILILCRRCCARSWSGGTRKPAGCALS
jgi:AcrR family transcriptional regulator